MRTRFRNSLALLAVAVLTASSLLALSEPSSAALVSLNPIVTKDLSTPGSSALALAQDLMGSGVTSVSNASYSGANAQLGKIDIADPAVVSFNHGVILSSGNIADIVGPNKSESTTGDMSSWPGINPGASDSDLTALIAGSQTVNPNTYDAASLQFDFVPTGSKIYFTYVFGSDEYLEWVNQFNDVFGFWVTNSSGTSSNCALTADGLPVSIDSVNTTVDSAEYRDNSFSNPSANPINIEPDGLTVEMICQAAVTPNVTNHIKLAIADTSDQILDSQVILKAGSLSTTKPESCNNGIDDNANGAVDMIDGYCKTTTTPAPPGIVNPGPSGGAPSYDGSPFSGIENGPVWLDANSLGWTLAPDAISTSWQVYVNGDASQQCKVFNSNGQPQTHQSISVGGVFAVSYAVCPQDGNFTARIDGWDSEGNSADDKDVDFTIANAPPKIDYFSIGQTTQTAVGETLKVEAYVSDVPQDALTCTFNFGAGVPETVSPESNGLCSATHTYTAEGDFVFQMTASDNQKATAAALSVVTVGPNQGGPISQTISLNNLIPASAWYGDALDISASSSSGLPVSVKVSGGCTNTGKTLTVSAATGTCQVTLEQSGNDLYLPATAVELALNCQPRPITLSAVTGHKQFGKPDPKLNYTLTSGSLAFGEYLSGEPSRQIGEAVGHYPIGIGNLTAMNPNYSITFIDGDFEITNAPYKTSVASDHRCSLLLDSSVFCSGTNSEGQLGSGNFKSSVSPVKALGASSASGIATGLRTSCAILTVGSLRCWGSNAWGLLTAKVTASNIPIALPAFDGTSAPKRVTAISIGSSHACAVLADTSVMCWGQNKSGQLGKKPSSGTSQPTSVKVGGKLLKKAIGIYAGNTFSCARISGSKSPVCWGTNYKKALGSIKF